MTTLVLGIAGGVIGGAIGGPIGAQVGYLAGTLLGNLLDPPKIEGPRLTDLKLQLSEYGKPIPIVYGVWRLAGNVIWQTDLVEHKQKSGGKGGPQVTNYTYSASFAVMLTSCYVDSIIEVYADGRKVWPGNESNFDFTFYQGTEDQLPDPTMEAEIGVGLVPAHRGCSYVVFSDLYLTEFGNRIPQLEFVISTKPRLRGLSIVKQNLTTGSASDNPGSFPDIVEWPSSGNITLSRQTVATTFPYTDLEGGKLYDPGDLSYLGPTDTTTSGLSFPNYGSGSPDYAVGMWKQSASADIPLWVQAGVTLHTDTDFTFAATLGIPGGEYVNSACLSQDRTMLFLFTSSVAVTGAVTKWYKFVDMLQVDSGTVSPSLSPIGWGVGWHPHGTGTPAERAGQALTAEKNGRYFWHASHGSAVTLYYIDDAKNFADWGGGSLAEFFPYAEGCECSIAACEDEGYAGLTRWDNLALLTRLGGYPTVPLSEIVADLSSRTTLDSSEYETSALTDQVRGYAVSAQMEVRNAIEPLRQAYFFDAVERDGVVVFVKRGGSSIVSFSSDDLAARSEGTDPPALKTIVRVQEAELPKRVYVEYVNPDFDFQKGVQYDERQVTSSQSETTLSLPINLSDEEAKNIATVHVWGSYQEREAFTWVSGREYLKYEPTDVVTVDGITLRIDRRQERQDGTIEWQGVISRSGLYTVAADVTGAVSSGTGQVAPSSYAHTRLILLDIPVVSQSDSPFGFYAAMCPSQDGPWSGATLYKSLDGGITYSPVASTDIEDTMGYCVGSPGVLQNYTGSLSLVDNTSSVDVTMYRDDMTLSSITGTALDNGGNLCAIKSGSGWEILQFQTATLIASSPLTYRLTGFYRGKLNTESYIASHAAGDEFVLFPCINVDAPESELNLSLKYKAVTYGAALNSTTAVNFTNTGQGATQYYNTEISHLPVFTGDLGSPYHASAGLVPAPSVGDCALGKFLSACGTWEIPAGGGGGLGSPGVSGGGMTLLASQTTSGSATLVTFSSIPAGYNALMIVYVAADPDTVAASAAKSICVSFNTDLTSGNYVARQSITGTSPSTAASGSAAFVASKGVPMATMPNRNGNANAFAMGQIHIPFYANTSFHKTGISTFSQLIGSTPTANLGNMSAWWKSTAAISRIDLRTDGTAFVNGSTFLLYGVG